ncbi:hypothetical protein K438DRAFT_1642241 [Mycena galopus ATCC 62051]|nr:hypothetical protein K438DRAFT_1642241 [Mycena galopus ATCC 62051]
MSTRQPRRSPRKHKKPGTKKAAKQAEPALPTIKWGADNGALTWALIAQLGVKENHLVLFGKDSKDELRNTSGDSKIAVYKRIGGVILPDLFATSPNALAKRVKGKAESLVDTYKTEVKKLRVTGGALENTDGSEGSQHEDDSETENNGEDSVHQFLACYISAAGPDHDTTPEARNIWEKITKDFKYFPTLHRFLAACSNIIPPVITTGVGPDGRKVVHLQPPTQHRKIDDNTSIDESGDSPPHAAAASWIQSDRNSRFVANTRGCKATGR